MRGRAQHGEQASKLSLRRPRLFVQTGGDEGSAAVVEVSGDLFDHVAIRRLILHGPGLTEHVHDDQPSLRRGGQGHHRGVPESTHVVDDLGAGAESSTRHFGFHRVDRHHSAPVCQRLDNRHHPGQLVLGRHWLSTRARGLATNVDDLGPLVDESQRVVDCSFGTGQRAAI